MGKIIVLVCMLISFSQTLVAALPASAWYFTYSYRFTLPDKNRDFNSEGGAQYQIGRTLGRYYSLDLAYQDQVFNIKNSAAHTAQVIYNISARRFFDLEYLQWFVVGELGKIDSKTSGKKISSVNYGLGVGMQYTIWEQGPAVSADLRFRVDDDDQSNPENDQYNDWLIAISTTIPFFNQSRANRAAAQESKNQPADLAASGGYILPGSEADQALGPLPVPTGPTPTPAEVGQANAADSTSKKPSTTTNATTPVKKSTDSSVSFAKTMPKPPPADTKDSIASSIDTLRAEIAALEDEEEEIEKADFSADTRTPAADKNKRKQERIDQKIGREVTVVKPIDTDSDGVMDADDQCADTPLGAPIDAKGCALDSDGDKVNDMLDLCKDTPAGVSVDDRGCGFDDDLDGIPNHKDRCNDTKEDVSVDAHGCELDSDGDGIVDRLDLCNGTVAGAKVEPMGCQLSDVVVLKESNFQSGASILDNSAKPILKQIYEIAQRNPDKRIEITSRDDGIGISEFNRRVSVGRANSILLYLLELGADAEFKEDKAAAKQKPPSLTAPDINHIRPIELRFVDIEKENLQDK
ncbi:MAG: OmpA family protein [Thiohalomonadales bacterium]